MNYRFQVTEVVLIAVKDQLDIPFIPEVNDEVEIIAYAVAEHMVTGEKEAAYQIRHLETGNFLFYRDVCLKRRPYTGDEPGSWDHCIWRPKVTSDAN